VELLVDGSVQATETSPVSQGQPSFSVVLKWQASMRGSYRLVVRAYNAGGGMGESEPISVVVVDRGPAPEPTPQGPQPTEPAAEASPSPPPPTPAAPEATPTAPPPPTATAPPPPPTSTPAPPPPTATTPSGPCLPSNVATVNVGPHPKGVTVHGQMVYVALHGAAAVKVINANNNTVVDTLDTGVPGAQQANGIVYHPDSGLLYVANKTDGSVSAIDPTGAASPIVIASNAEPFGLAVAGQYVYVANFGADRVSRINVSTHTTQNLTDTYHKPALLASLGDNVFVPTNGAGRVYRVPPAGPRIGIGDNKTGYFGVAVNPNSKRVFVTDRDGGDLIKIDGNTNSVEGKLHLPQRPYAVAVNASKGRVFVVAAEANLLYVIRGPTLEIIDSVAVGAQGAAEGGQGIALWGDRIYVSNFQGGTVTVLDDSACP
jgi:DNA-binding beta-propeller fold protein YncE